MAAKDGVGGRIEPDSRVEEDVPGRAHGSQPGPPGAGPADRGGRGRSPSLAPLTRIARVLGVRVGTFLDDVEQRRDPSSTARGRSSRPCAPPGVPARPRPAATSTLCARRAGGTASRSPSSSTSCRRPTRTTEELPPRARSSCTSSAATVELLYGKDTYLLAEGDSIYYDSIVARHVQPPRTHPRGSWPSSTLPSDREAPPMQFLEKTIGAVLDEQVALFPDRTSSSTRTGACARSASTEVDARVRAMAKGFLAMGIGKGDKVRIWPRTSPTGSRSSSPPRGWRDAPASRSTPATRLQRRAVT